MVFRNYLVFLGVIMVFAVRKYSFYIGHAVGMQR